jgi:prepilin-type N-terminal cleavage/methylation domain-containing protein
MTSRPLSSRRQGFTFIELLTVFALIAIGLALLAPAIQHSRDLARRAKCKLNLKQLGLALHNYHDTFLAFPPGYITGTKQATPDAAVEMAWNSGWGWQASVLPYMDQAPLFNKLDFRAGLPTTAADKLIATKIPTYRCAEDTGAAIVSKVKVLGPFPNNRAGAVVQNSFARSNYVGVSGWDNDWHLGMTDKQGNPNGAKDANGSNWSKPELGQDFRDGTIVYVGLLKTPNKKPVPNARDFHGMFGENSFRQMRDISDGLSNIIMVGERATPTKNDSETDVGNVIWAGVPDRSTRAGQALGFGTSFHPVNHGLKPNAVPNTTGFSSLHGGGSHFLMGDGSLRYVSDQVDIALLRKASLIDDGLKSAELPVGK